MTARIPTLDITRFDTDREAFVAELGTAYREWGFAGIRNHGVPQAQIDAVIALAKDIVARHGIAPGHVLGHADIAPGRKQDPGPQFPWKQLADAGLIAWPEPGQVAARLAYYRDAPLPDVLWFQQRLANVGYRVPQTGVLDETTRAVISTFQMKYRPADIGGEPDAQTAAWLDVASTPGGLQTQVSVLAE